MLTHVGESLEGVAPGRRVPVSIAGRDFELGADFVEDIRSHNQQGRIANLKRALLVLHSPVDDIVSIDNASAIFQAARHPKSFVSLDDANHLLTRKSDADYAAAVIAAWADRYVGDLDTDRVDLSPPLQGLRVEETGGGKFQVRVTTAAGGFLADEPASVDGLGSGPTPYDLLGAGLGACTAMTCRLYADRKGWPLERVVVEVGHLGRTASAPDHFTRKIGFRGGLDEAQTARLLEIADRCPVHRTLTESATVSTERLPDGPTGEGVEDSPEDHLHRMQELCKDPDLKGDRP